MWPATPATASCPTQVRGQEPLSPPIRLQTGPSAPGLPLRFPCVAAQLEETERSTEDQLVRASSSSSTGVGRGTGNPPHCYGDLVGSPTVVPKAGKSSLRPQGLVILLS